MTSSELFLSGAVFASVLVVAFYQAFIIPHIRRRHTDRWLDLDGNWRRRAGRR